MNKKFGVLGYGVMGKHHARVYDSLDQLKAIYDSNEKVAEEASDSYSYPEWVSQVLGTTDLNKLWDEELLGVSICTPTETHCSLAKECLSHGISTLIEKPISFSLDEAYSLQEFHESLSNGTDISVGYIERFNPVIDALIFPQHPELLNFCILCEEVIGTLLSINIKRVGGEPRSATNVIYDLMTHDLDLLTTLLPLEDIKHISGHKRISSGITCAAQAILSSHGVLCSLESDWESAIKTRRLEVTGTKACIRIDLIKRTIDIDFKIAIPEAFLSLVANAPSAIPSFSIGHRDKRVSIQLHNTEPLHSELVNFTNGILNPHRAKDDRVPFTRVPLEDAIRTLTLTELVDKEAKII